MRGAAMRWLPVMGMAGILTAGLAATGWTADAVLPDQPFGVPIDSDGVQRATVILDSYSYVPNHVIVEAGKPVELTLTSVTMITPPQFHCSGSSRKGFN